MIISKMNICWIEFQRKHAGQTGSSTKAVKIINFSSGHTEMQVLEAGIWLHVRLESPVYPPPPLI